VKWTWNDIDPARYQRALEEKPVKVDYEKETAIFRGSTRMYSCTLTHCECNDFQMRLKGQQPCKHILSLGMALGAYDPKAVARQFEGVMIKDRLALAFGYYHLFNDPIMSDSEYDELKAQWADLLPRADPVKSAGEALYEKALERLKAANVEYVDRISVGGGLYFFDEAIANELKQAGYPVQYAAQGSRSTSNRPAWYLRVR